MVADADLASLHTDPCFGELVNRVRSIMLHPTSARSAESVPPSDHATEPEGEIVQSEEHKCAQDAPSEFAAELAQLQAMGLTDKERCLEILREHNGNMHMAVCILLDS